MIDVVDDADVVLGVVVAVQSSGVLGDGALPGDRQREHQRVQARVVEPLADEPAGCEDDPRFIGREDRIGGASCPCAEPAVEYDNPIRVFGHQLRKREEVFAALGQDEREASLTELCERVARDASGTPFVAGDSTKDLLDAGLGRQQARVEPSVLGKQDATDGRLDRNRRRDRVSHSPALHRQDRVMAVAALGCRRQPSEASRAEFSQHAFGGEGGNVMTLVDDNVSVAAGPIEALARDRLDHRDVDPACARLADAGPDIRSVEVEDLGESGDPLLE